MSEKYQTFAVHFMDWLAQNLDGLARLFDSAVPVLALLCVTYVVHVAFGRTTKLKKRDLE